MNRRDFLLATAMTGAGLALSPMAFAEDAKQPAPAGAKPGREEDLHIAMIGLGSQGRTLMTTGCLKIPGIRFRAICDIWPYNQRFAGNILNKYDQPVNVYADYREMLAKEKDLDAVIIATPDWVHAEQSIACLEAGLHVYCEKEMANTLEDARRMVLAAKASGRLLQIGHQRRSNPRYLLAEKMIHKDKMLGRITHFNGQWNRPQLQDVQCPKKEWLDEAALKKYGYDTMERFLNWRWFKRFSSGPIADLGSHQVDIFNWFLRARPVSVAASGGVDYYKGSEWYDNVLAIYEYKTDDGIVRGCYNVYNTTSHGGYFETFMGDEGSMVISEDGRKGFIFREVKAKRQPWEDVASKVETMGQSAIELKVGESRKASDGAGPRSLDDSREQAGDGDEKEPKGEPKPHLPHVENFFNAIRKGTPLSCPAALAYETAVSVLRVNESLERGQKIEFVPEEFMVEIKKKP